MKIRRGERDRNLTFIKQIGKTLHTESNEIETQLNNEKTSIDITDKNPDQEKLPETEINELLEIKQEQL